MATTIKLTNAALDETSQGEIILRGVLAPESLHLLQTDDYQREAFPVTSLASILEALKMGQVVPDIEIGMRGQAYKERDDAFYLHDPVFIIDGLQRVSAATHLLNTDPKALVRLGATVHFSTTREWERERFRILNTLRSKVSPSVILRNRRDQSPAVNMLYVLSMNERAFTLYRRVTWSQRMLKGELISALTFAKVIGILHSHKAPTRRNSLFELVPALDKAVEIVGTQTMRENIRAFFAMIDECWGIRRVQYREGAVHMRGTFLQVLARLVSDHHDFWQQPDERRFFVAAPLRRKITQFPIHDPQITNLASSGGKSREILYMLLRDHINSGKRTKRLASRTGDMVPVEDIDEDEAAS